MKKKLRFKKLYSRQTKKNILKLHILLKFQTLTNVKRNYLNSVR